MNWDAFVPACLTAPSCKSEDPEEDPDPDFFEEDDEDFDEEDDEDEPE